MVLGDGQGGLACCDSWGRKESDTTEWLIWSDLIPRSPVIIFKNNTFGTFLDLIKALLNAQDTFHFFLIEMIYVDTCITWHLECE